MVQAADGRDFFAVMLEELAGVVIGMVMVVIYWVQSNLLLGGLTKTDGKHATLTLFQIFLLLFYLYAVSLGTDFDNDPAALAMQSIGAALVGFTAWGAWVYAAKDRRLLAEDVSNEEVKHVTIQTLAEPLAAVITLSVVFIDEDLWNWAWLTYIPLASLLRWRRVRGQKRSE